MCSTTAQWSIPARRKSSPLMTPASARSPAPAPRNGRWRKESHLAPLAGRGRIASPDAMRVRGTLRESNSHGARGDSPSPHPSPRKNGEREKRHLALPSDVVVLPTIRLFSQDGGKTPANDDLVAAIYLLFVALWS